MAARRARWGFWLWPVLLVGLLALAAASAVTLYELNYAGRIYPGVQVAGIPLGGLTLDEAQKAVQDELTPYPGAPVVLRYGERTWSFSPDNLGVSVDSEATVALAFAVGRSNATPAMPTAGVQETILVQWRELLADLTVQALAMRNGYAVQPRLQVDEGKVTYALMRIAREVDLAPREGTLTISGLDVVAAPGQAGRQVDLDTTRAALWRAARSGEGGTVALVVDERQPVISSVAAAEVKARNLLSQPLTLIAQGADATQRFAVDRAALRQWLKIAAVPDGNGSVDLSVQLDEAQVRAYLQEIAAQLNRPVQDAELDLNPDTMALSVVSPSQVGQQLDVDAGLAAVTGLVADPSFLDAAAPRTVTLPVNIVQPEVDSSKVDEMGIVELVSQGTTTFAGSSADRVHNIVTAADKFHNVVVPPGEDFSFNKYVGEINSANGFTDSLIIAGDRTAVGVGGGVCQVSTTMFRAALWGGFPITQRWAHGYVVSWYGKPGMDATIYTPDVDFRFNNDTGHFLLIQPTVDTANGQITFSIYGTRVDRTVEIGEPTITNVQPAPKPLYQEDKTLAAGVIKQVDWAVNGLDAVVVRTVRNGDGTEHEDTFKSHYQPWRAVYLYGPGTELPAGALDAAAQATTNP